MGAARHPNTFEMRNPLLTSLSATNPTRTQMSQETREISATTTKGLTDALCSPLNMLNKRVILTKEEKRKISLNIVANPLLAQELYELRSNPDDFVVRILQLFPHGTIIVN